jgi:hypothetical protein
MKPLIWVASAKADFLEFPNPEEHVQKVQLLQRLDALRTGDAAILKHAAPRTSGYDASRTVKGV